NIWDGELQDDLRPYTYDPRRCPCELAVDDGETVRLHQSPTEYRGLESWWEFRLVPPHYVDLRFECVATRSFPSRSVTVLWASYIANPTDHRMRFLTPDGQLTPRQVAEGCPTI